VTSPRERVAILISGRGSNMGALIAAAKASDYPAEIVGVFSNNLDAPGLATAAAEGIATTSLSHKAYSSKAEFEAAMTAVLEDWHTDIIALAGFMRLLSPEFCARWAGRLINIHPSLLPRHKGLHTHEQALADGSTAHGCTVHFVTPGMDEGPTIAQAIVPVLPGDTPDTLAARVLVEEHKLYPRALGIVAASLAGTTPLIRRVTVADVAAYRDIRLEALLNAPTAFGASYEHESRNGLTDFEGYLTNSYVAGAWLNGSLIGTAGFRLESHAKVAHRGNIWGVYVQPEARGRGVARALITTLLDHARTQVLQVHLCVITDNDAARHLYEALGFTTYGTEPRSLCVDGRYFDEHLMVRRFDA
jgi:formyltetrahydrofolate-dependent phosphoribosylglycinamide formyltransferase